MAPLTKRLPRQLKNNWTRYLALFLMFIFFVGICAGFKAACSSMQKISDGERDAYTIEDGRFTSNFKVSGDVIDKVEAKGVKVSELFSLETSATYQTGNNGCDFRVYKDRTDVDLLTYHEGTVPKASDEIVLDRNFCVSNEISIGDKITVEGVDFKVVGIVSSPDNVMLFKNTSDMMGNSISFGMGWVADSGFDKIRSAGANISYNYAFVCNDRSLSSADRIDLETEISDVLTEEKVTLSSFLDCDSNAGITFAKDDFEGDSAIMDAMLIIIVVLFAFIFAVLISSTIDGESAVIGTLMASGYRKGEILRHYMVLPTLTGLFGTLFGNLFGYTAAINYVASLYYTSYSLPPFVATFDWGVFLETSMLPFVLLVGINWFALARKMRLTPLQFLRHDLKKARRISKFNIPEKLPFPSRFRIRVFLRNKGNFFTLFLGITLASLLLVWGFCIIPTMDGYCESLKDAQPAEHVYTLKTQVEIEGSDADREAWAAALEYRDKVDQTKADEEELGKMVAEYQLARSEYASLLGLDVDKTDAKMPSDYGYSNETYGNLTVGELGNLFDKIGDLDTDDENLHPVNSAKLSQSTIDQAEKIAVTTIKIPRRYADSDEEVTVYGIQENSRYWTDFSVAGLKQDQIVVGTGVTEKCAVEVNSEFSASAMFSNNTYTFDAVEAWGPRTNMNVYMSIDEFRKVFGEDADYFNGYISNEDLQIDNTYLARDTTPKDLEAVGEEMNSIMSKMVGIIVFLAVAIYLIMMYLLTKVIVDRSARSISYMKVFGYKQREINRLYINAVTATVIISLLVSIPVIILGVEWLMKIAMADYAGNIVAITPMIELVKTFAIGFATYILVAYIDVRHIRKVPMAIALKVQE